MTEPLTAEDFINWMWSYEYRFNNQADHSVFRNRFSRQIARLNEDAARADSLAADLAAAVVRADRAEAERDKWRQIASDAEKDADEAEDELDRLRAAEPRPLTPDALVELVKTSEARLADGIRALCPDVAMSTYQIASAVFDALTPPARPEWDALHDVLSRTHRPPTTDELTDVLYAEGVRVTGGN